MTIRELISKFVFQTEGTEKIDKLQGQLEGIKSRLDFMIGAEIAKKMIDLTEKFARFGEELHIASQSAGISVEAFQKLTYSAQQASVSQSEMEMALFRLSRRLNDARMGSQEAENAFRQAGISAGQVKGFKTSQDALLALADRMKAMQDPIKRAALGQELMGRGSLHMVGYLTQGSAAIRKQGDEAERLGLILSEGQVAALVSAEHALQRFWGLLKAIGASIAANLAPGIEYLINDFIKFFSIHRQIIELNINTWLYDLGYAFGALWTAVKFGIDLLIQLASHFHLEGHIVEAVATIGSIVAGLLVLGRVVSFASSALQGLGIAFGILTSPAVLVVGALTAIGIAIHDIIAAFSGKKTWLEGFIEWLGIAQQVQAVFFWIFDHIAAIGKIFSGGLGGLVGGLFGGGGAPAAISQLNAGPQVAGGNNSQASYQVTAPITIHVPPGTPPGAVGAAAQDGVKEHLDRLMRETRRGTASAVAY